MNRPSFYDLVPALYRILDYNQGKVLEDYMDILESQYKRVEASTTELYSNWFVETCDPRFIPYIAELVGIEDLNTRNQAQTTSRTRVGNAVQYRRAKGTRHALRGVLSSVTGYPTLILECLPSSGCGCTPMPDLGEPCCSESRILRNGHGIDPIPSPVCANKAGPDVLAIYFFRLQAMALTRSTPKPLDQPGLYSFSPTGRDQPLFAPARGCESRVVQHFPLWAYPSPLEAVDLDNYIAATVANPLEQLDKAAPVAIYRGQKKIHPKHMATTDLRHPHMLDYLFQANPHVHALIDPATARFALREPSEEEQISVDWSYGSNGPMGGGPYYRGDQLLDPKRYDWSVHVCMDFPEDNPSQGCFRYLVDALEAFPRNKKSGLIRVIGNHTHDLSNATLDLGACSLTVVAENGFRPVLQGDLQVHYPDTRAQLILDGFLMTGALTVREGGADAHLGLTLRHTTLVPNPGHPSICVKDSHHGFGLDIKLHRVICGGIDYGPIPCDIQAVDSIIGDGKVAVYPSQMPLLGPSHGRANLTDCTLLGSAVFRALTASGVIFRNRVEVLETAPSRLRYCYVPPDSLLPPTYRCAGSGCEAHAQHQIAAHAPIFDSLTYGDPAYARLSRNNSDAILLGNEDGGSLGAWHFLNAPLLTAQLGELFDEYLPLGLFADTYFAT